MMQQQKQQSSMAQPQHQPQVQQPKPVQQQQQQPVQEEYREEEENRLPLPQLPDRERLIVKQTAFKGAIELMTKMEFETKQYNDLINEIETLTVEFYRIIVTNNER